jgi:hypothetical protein
LEISFVVGVEGFAVLYGMLGLIEGVVIDYFSEFVAGGLDQNWFTTAVCASSSSSLMLG